jgi:hypothetical protein
MFAQPQQAHGAGKGQEGEHDDREGRQREPPYLVLGHRQAIDEPYRNHGRGDGLARARQTQPRVLPMTSQMCPHQSRDAQGCVLEREDASHEPHL